MDPLAQVAVLAMDVVAAVAEVVVAAAVAVAEAFHKVAHVAQNQSRTIPSRKKKPLSSKAPFPPFSQAPCSVCS
jgi:hypothetical protein